MADNRVTPARTTRTSPTAKTTSAGRSVPDQLEGDFRLSRAAARSPRAAQNLEQAEAGDDSALMPLRPTRTIDPSRPRTVSAGYDVDNEILYVRFRGNRNGTEGAAYAYYNVTRSDWKQFKDQDSPGRYINRVLNSHPYTRLDL